MDSKGIASLAATPTTTTEISAPLQIKDRPGVYASKVREFYKDTPILIEIARCESGFAQYDANMSVIRGKVNDQDVGIMQINEKYHLEKSHSLGYDIYSVEGNLAYAKYMYEREGAQPWKASSPCWSKALATK